MAHFQRSHSSLIAALVVVAAGAGRSHANYLGVAAGVPTSVGFSLMEHHSAMGPRQAVEDAWVLYRSDFEDAFPWLKTLSFAHTGLFANEEHGCDDCATRGSPDDAPFDPLHDRCLGRHPRSPTHEPWANSGKAGTAGMSRLRDPSSQNQGLLAARSIVESGHKGRIAVEVNEPYYLWYASRLFRPPRPNRHPLRYGTCIVSTSEVGCALSDVHFS
jgi:hypothetical protein